MVGAITSAGNFFLQYYDIIWCRWHDCGNKNSVITETVDEKIDRLLKIKIPSDKIKGKYENQFRHKRSNR